MKDMTVYGILSLVLVGLSAPAAMAEILVAPTRVVMENGERTEELVLVNKGTETAAYRISLQNRRMLTDGSMEDAEVALPGEAFASEFIRYAPRRVVLEPGAKQTIRISARTNDLEDGEYRSHLRLQSAPMSAGRTLQSATVDGEADCISIQLVAIRSITIPVITRVGQLDATVDMPGAEIDASTNPDESLLVVKLKREGSRSVFGDIHLYVDDVKDPVFIARGVAVYTPNTERDVVLAIPNALRGALKGRNVRIAYVSADPKAPKQLAELRTTIS